MWEGSGREGGKWIGRWKEGIGGVVGVWVVVGGEGSGGGAFEEESWAGAVSLY